MNSLKTLAFSIFFMSLFLVSGMQAAQIAMQDIQGVNEFDPVYGVPTKRKITIDYNDNAPLNRAQKNQVKGLINGRPNVTCKFINYQHPFCIAQVNSFERYLTKHYLTLIIKR